MSTRLAWLLSKYRSVDFPPPSFSYMSPPLPGLLLPVFSLRQFSVPYPRESPVCGQRPKEHIGSSPIYFLFLFSFFLGAFSRDRFARSMGAFDALGLEVAARDFDGVTPLKGRPVTYWRPFLSSAWPTLCHSPFAFYLTSLEYVRS